MNMPSLLEMAMRGIAEKHVHISLVTDAGVKHGLLWVRGNESTQGRSTRVGFRLDMYRALRYGINYWTLRRLCRQLTRMGIDATHLELFGVKRRYCYCLETYREIFCETNHVPLVSRHAGTTVTA